MHSKGCAQEKRTPAIKAKPGVDIKQLTKWPPSYAMVRDTIRA